MSEDSVRQVCEIAQVPGGRQGHGIYASREDRQVITPLSWALQNRRGVDKWTVCQTG